MTESVIHVIDFLNSCAGLFSFLAFLSAIIVPIVIYRKQRKDVIRDAKQDAQDQLDAMNEVSRFSFTEEVREHYAKKEYLRKKANR